MVVVRGKSSRAAQTPSSHPTPSAHTPVSYTRASRQPATVRLASMLRTVARAGAAAGAAAGCDAAVPVVNALPGSWTGPPRQFTLNVAVDAVTCTQ